MTSGKTVELLKRKLKTETLKAEEEVEKLRSR